MGTETVSTAQALIEAGEYERAERLLNELRPDSDNPQILYLLGLTRYRAGQYGAALDAFTLLAQATPHDHRALYSVAIAREKLGDASGAIEALSRSLAIEPDFGPAREKLQALQAQTDSGSPTGGDQQPSAATLAMRLETGTRTGAYAEPLATGRRRLSSTGDVALSALVPGTLGLTIYAFNERLSERLAEWSMLGRTPGHFANRLADLDATGIAVGRAAVVNDLDNATSTLAGRIATFTSVLDVAGLALLACAVVLLVGAVLVARLTQYEVHEHRIDVTSGVLRRRTRTLWLYALTNVVYEQPLWLLATGNARIRMDTDGGERATITGYGSAGHMRRLWAELRDAALTERRAMRRWWV